MNDLGLSLYHSQFFAWQLTRRAAGDSVDSLGSTLMDGLAGEKSEVLLTATPLQNSLLKPYGLVSIIDERVFGDLDSFRRQDARLNDNAVFQHLRSRIAPLCKRTLRKQVAHTIAYTRGRRPCL